MFDKLTTVGARDFSQRYLGTFGFFTTDSKRKLLVRLDRVDMDVTPVSVRFVDKDGITFHLNADTDREFEFISPKSEWYNTTEGAVFCKRTPQRQWSRGICGRNTALHVLDHPGRNGMRPLEVGFPTLGEMFQPTRKHTIEEAGVLEKSYALSPQIALSFKTKELYIFDEVQGTFSHINDVFRVKLEDYSMWATEVRDAFRRKNLTTLVE